MAGLILLMGVELAKSSVEKILHPAAVDFSVIALVILAVSICVKLYMCLYNRRIGKKIRSAAMEATAADSLSDTTATAAVLLAPLRKGQGRCGSSFAGPPGRGSGGAAGQPPCPGTGPAGPAYPAAGRSCHPAAGRTGEPEDRTHRICRKAGACIKKTKTNREPLRRLRYTGGVLCLGYCFGVRRNHV